MTTCPEIERTHALADGELSATAAEAARAHLADCAICQAELADVLQLAALGAELPIGKAAPLISLAWYRRKRTVVIGGALSILAAAAIAMLLLRRQATTTTTDDRPPQLAIALAHDRGIEARIAWPGAAAYRAYDVQRGDATHESIPLAQLALLEQRGDLRGVAMAYLLNGDAAQAKAYLSRAPDATATDRAVVALAAAEPAAALALADQALATDPNDAAARWNRALALRDLGLVRAASAELAAIAAANEPGWGAEAAARAARLDREWAARDGLVKRVLGHGTAPTVDDARELPGLTRLYFYDALRSATARPAVDALAPIADVLGPDAQTALRRIATANFTQRAPLARTYAALLAGTPPADRAAYLAQLRAYDGPEDLRIGALIKLGDNGGRDVRHAELDDFRRAAAASIDPWMRLLGVEQGAIDALKRGDLLDAEAELRTALAGCTIPYRCARLHMFLGETYLLLERVPEARGALAAAWKTAHAAGELLIEQAILSQLADASAQDDATGSGLPLARAYGRELELRDPTSCANLVTEHQIVATALINRLDRAGARAELAKITCAYADTPFTLFNRVELAREAAAPAEVAAIRAAIAALRAEPDAAPSTLAMLDTIEGRLLGPHDRAGAAPLLRRAIERADRLPAWDLTVRRARAYAYAELVLDAAQAGDASAVLAALDQEIGNAKPAGCVVGVAVDDQRRLVVTRGTDGTLHLAYDETRATTAIEPARIVPPTLLGTLAGCATVDVLARAPLHGTPRLLPDDLAWSYVSPRPRPVGPSAAKRVLVADVVPPASLGLPRLAAWTLDPGVELVGGETATPARVLDAIADAGEVVIDVHGIVDAGGPDASFLALSPDPRGYYALTPNLVRTAHLAGNPLVVLAACHGSTGAAVMHEAWSLPAAFVFAGARAVVASPEPMPDREAAAFFAELRARISTGTPVAVALRDVRRAWLTASRGTWIRDLIVFE